MFDKLKAILAIVTAPLIVFFGPVAPLLSPILWLVLIDIITGIYVVRIVNKEALTSRGFFKKLPQGAMFLVALSASIHADPFFVQFGITQFQAAKLVISFYGLYELFSILENLGKSGLPVATQLSKLLQAKLPDEAKAVAEAKKDDSV